MRDLAEASARELIIIVIIIIAFKGAVRDFSQSPPSAVFIKLKDELGLSKNSFFSVTCFCCEFKFSACTVFKVPRKLEHQSITASPKATSIKSCTSEYNYPQRRNVTTSVVGLKNGHRRKNITRNCEPQRYSWEMQKKKKHNCKSKGKFHQILITSPFVNQLSTCVSYFLSTDAGAGTEL